MSVLTITLDEETSPMRCMVAESCHTEKKEEKNRNIKSL